MQQCASDEFEVVFCSMNCYMQFNLAHKSASEAQAKVCCGWWSENVPKCSKSVRKLKKKFKLASPVQMYCET